MTILDLAGRVALVTGGGKGIGRACTLELAGRGADVAINFRSDADAAERTATEVRALGRRALVAPADITDPDAAEKMVEAVRSTLGGVDLLVNNAAYSKLIPPAELTIRAWRRIFAANVDAVMQLTWLVKEDMKARGGGAIVNISSTSALRPDPTMIAYGASKAALNHFTTTAALALVGDGIRVNAVAPGFTRTPRVDTVDSATQKRILSRVPMGRLGTAEEVAAVVAFLLSDAASYVTGQIVSVAGGP